MRLVTASTGKQVVKMSKSEWTAIGKKAGWVKVAYTPYNPQNEKERKDCILSCKQSIALLDSGINIISKYQIPTEQPQDKTLLYYLTEVDRMASHYTQIAQEIKEVQGDITYFSRLDDATKNNWRPEIINGLNKLKSKITEAMNSAISMNSKSPSTPVSGAQTAQPAQSAAQQQAPQQQAPQQAQSKSKTTFKK